MGPRCLRRSHVLPGFIHRLNVFFGLHPERRDAGAPVVLHRVFVVEAGRALVGGRPHGLHALHHGRWAVEEAVAGVGRLQALRRAHEAWDGVHGRGTGDGRRQPGVQGHGVGHRPHGGSHGRTVERQHGGVVELHRAGVHLFLPSPLGPPVLEPDLFQDRMKYDEMVQ